MTKKDRFWLQHDANDHLERAIKELEIAEVKFREAGYCTVADKIYFAQHTMNDASLSAGGAHAHACRGWVHWDNSGDEAV